MNIIELAKRVGYPIQHPEWQKATEEFAALVEAAARVDEREECAKIADEWDKVNKLSNYGAFIALQIRARGTT